MPSSPNTATLPIRLGTCSWSTRDWIGKVYGADTKAADYIQEYAQRFNTVEVDSTFYGTPRRTTVEGWRDRTPADFVFAAKAPQVITHEKFLENCEKELAEFLNTMEALESRLGPLVFQFPYYAKKRQVTQDEFLRRLGPFLKQLPDSHGRWVVEVRNKAWINRRLTDLLAEYQVTLALIDHPWMHRPGQLAAIDEIATGPFAYIRWLGDRYAIEKITTTWGEHVLDRRADLEQWVPVVQKLVALGKPVFGYINSHYSGYAPGDVEALSDLLGLR